MRLPTRQQPIDIAAGTLVDRPEPYGPDKDIAPTNSEADHESLDNVGSGRKARRSNFSRTTAAASSGNGLHGLPALRADSAGELRLSNFWALAHAIGLDTGASALRRSASRPSDRPVHRQFSMLRKYLSCVLAGLLIVVGVTMLVMEPRKAHWVAAAFCVVAGILWLCDELRGSRDGQ